MQVQDLGRPLCHAALLTSHFQEFRRRFKNLVFKDANTPSGIYSERLHSLYVEIISGTSEFRYSWSGRNNLPSYEVQTFGSVRCFMRLNEKCSS